MRGEIIGETRFRTVLVVSLSLSQKAGRISSQQNCQFIFAFHTIPPPSTTTMSTETESNTDEETAAEDVFDVDDELIRKSLESTSDLREYASNIKSQLQGVNKLVVHVGSKLILLKNACVVHVGRF